MNYSKHKRRTSVSQYMPVLNTRSHVHSLNSKHIQDPYHHS